MRIGKAAMIRTLVARQVQVNIGTFIQVMPGARIFTMVVKKFTPVSKVPTPDICNAQM